MIMDYFLLIVVGFVIILIGIFSIVFRKYDNTKQVQFFTFSILIIISGYSFIVIAASTLYSSSLEKRIEILEQQVKYINIPDEVDYSIMEIDSITGDTIYRECSMSYE